MKYYGKVQQRCFGLLMTIRIKRNLMDGSGNYSGHQTLISSQASEHFVTSTLLGRGKRESSVLIDISHQETPGGWIR
jgi:hypothetical protein